MVYARLGVCGVGLYPIAGCRTEGTVGPDENSEAKRLLALVVGGLLTYSVETGKRREMIIGSGLIVLTVLLALPDPFTRSTR